MSRLLPILLFFFFNDTATTEIYTLSLHDALPIFAPARRASAASFELRTVPAATMTSSPAYFCATWEDRKSTRLNSSHDQISYAVFCLKKKKIRGSALCIALHLAMTSLRQRTALTD